MRFDRVIDGNLDQASSFFSEPVPTEAGAELWLDMSKVMSINSTGIRRWMEWTQNLPSTLKVFLSHCSMNFVVQAYLIDGFFPKNCRVESVNSFFFCDIDSEEKAVLLKRNQDYFYAEDTGTEGPEIRLPSIQCAQCSQIMEPDFIEARAFAFLKK